MRRQMVWVEEPRFRGWACSGCAWSFNASGAPTGKIDGGNAELRVVARRRVQIPSLQRASQSHDARALNSRTNRDHAVTSARFAFEVVWSQMTVPNSTASV